VLLTFELYWWKLAYFFSLPNSAFLLLIDDVSECTHDEKKPAGLRIGFRTVFHNSDGNADALGSSHVGVQLREVI
jgi:hypothetical protein